MSEPHDPETSAPPAEQAEPAPTEPTQPPPRRRSGAVPWLAALLVLVIAGVASSPAWAPAVAPLLPWQPQETPARNNEVPAQLRQLQQRVDGLEGLAARVDRLERLGSRIAKLEQGAARLDQVEATAKDAQQQGPAAADAVQKLEQRLTAVEARLATVPAGNPELSQQLDKLGASVKAANDRLDAIEKNRTDAAGAVNSLGGRLDALEKSDQQQTAALAALGSRLDAVEKAEQRQAGADRTDTGLLLVLLQLRDAVAAGRPFAAEYDAFAALAHDRPKIAAAAAALAAHAQHGVATREELRKKLDALAPEIVDAKTAAPAGWGSQAWARMQSLVTVRRIGGAGQSPSEAALGEAQRELAQGDLAAAIGRIKALSGASAEAAKPWIELAEARLDTERALQKTQQLLTEALAAQRRPGRP